MALLERIFRGNRGVPAESQANDDADAQWSGLQHKDSLYKKEFFDK